ncbi:MAG: hypothetical protein ACK56F_10525, partial [bacterium]
MERFLNLLHFPQRDSHRPARPQDRQLIAQIEIAQSPLRLGEGLGAEPFALGHQLQRAQLQAEGSGQPLLLSKIKI